MNQKDSLLAINILRIPIKNSPPSLELAFRDRNSRTDFLKGILRDRRCFFGVAVRCRKYAGPHHVDDNYEYYCRKSERYMTGV